MDPSAGIVILEKALRELFGPAFDDEMRAHAEKEPWFAASISASELLRYRIQDNVEKGTDSLWVFESLRVSERKHLAAKVGIDMNAMIRLSPSELANAILAAIGLPTSQRTGLSKTTSVWSHIRSLVQQDEDEKAAVLSRQRAERLLRTLAHFYCNCGRAEIFGRVLADPGSLKLPKRLQQVTSIPEADRNDELSRAFAEDDWADLGFLLMYVRKVSALLEKEGARAITGEPLLIMTQKEQEAFEGLSKALQSYAHDKPTKLETRQSTLESAVGSVTAAVLAMASRSVIPDELVVLETCSAVLGPVFRGILEDGSQLRLNADPIPSMGRRVLFVPVARRDYARCDWVESPWPAE